MASIENPLPPRPFRQHSSTSVKQSRLNRKNTEDVNDNNGQEEGTFRSSSKIDMKGLLSVANMSISPSSRDIVMASRDGLFIIDLDNPLNLPQFLPQGGMWEIADVQWNPHPSWSEYIISTSGEKLLIWNLKLHSKTHIQHTLQSHSRAITDINWHNSTPSRLATCAMDSWVWLWDLRTPSRPTTKIKPTMGLSAFNETATQVKWNRRNSYLLASSHNEEILIWDERKGSMPISRFTAHESKIYGIDWSRQFENKLTTCSLDKTIKTWDIKSDPKTMHPLKTFVTDYPVWRARNLPFGDGFLAQPQRGRHKLDMYSFDQPDYPVHAFEGLTGVPKEYIWRVRGGSSLDNDDREFQLITWDKDAVLRFWPIDTSILQKVGFEPGKPINVPYLRRGAVYKSYRDELALQSALSAAITAPTHQSGVLASVKAVAPMIPRSASQLSLPSSISPINYLGKKPLQTVTEGNKSGNMTMGKTHKKTQFDPLAYWAGVEEDRKRSSSAGSPSTQRSTSKSRTGHDSPNRRGRKSARSVSIAPSSDSEPEHRPTLAKEITQAAQKFNSPKLKIDGIDFNSNNRRCNIEMEGPNGVFLRILFKFPEGYPGGAVPVIDIDRNRKIKPTKRAFILRELRRICSAEPLGLEPCIRFLLGLPGQGAPHKPFSLESDSEEDDVQVDVVPEVAGAAGTAVKIQQNQPPRERTAQAVFSVNGTLVRIVASDNARNKQDASPTRRDTISSGKAPNRPGDLPTALRGLAKLAQELPAITYADPNVEEFNYNFADSFSTQPGVKHTGILGPLWDRGMPFKFRNRGRAKVEIQSYPHPDPDDFDPILASKFIYTATDALKFCAENAVVAASYGRHDYRRILESLATLLGASTAQFPLWAAAFGEGPEVPFGSGPMGRAIQKIYNNLIARRNLQMLAMFSIAVLLTDKTPQRESMLVPPSPSATPAQSEGYAMSVHPDYFTFRPRNEISRTISPIPVTPSTPPPPDPGTPPAAYTPPAQSSFGNVVSKAGAFSSVLYPLWFSSTSEGSEPSHKQRGSDPSTPAPSEIPGSIPVPQKSGFLRSGIKSPRPRRGKSDSTTTTPTLFPSSTSGSNGTGSIAMGLGRVTSTGRASKKRFTTPVPTPGTTQRTTITFAQVGLSKIYLTSAIPQESYKRPGSIPEPSAKLMTKKDENLLQNDRSTLDEGTRFQCITHIRVYADLLFRAGLLEARVEVLSVPREAEPESVSNNIDADPLVIESLCRTCGASVFEDNERTYGKCLRCHTLAPKPACSYCRLPVSKLSRTCLSCNHVTHLACWDKRTSVYCATGCGCECPKDATFQVPAPKSLNPMSPLSPTSPSSVTFLQYAS